MKKKLLFSIIAVLAFLPFASAVMAMQFWDLEGYYEVSLECTSGCSGTYVHTLHVTDHSDPLLVGNGYYNANPSYTWDMAGQVDEHSVEMQFMYTGLNPGYYVDLEGVIQSDGTMMGSAQSSSGQTFNWSTTDGSALFMRAAAIVLPMEDEILSNEMRLEAYLVDNDEDPISWAVRRGTCAAGTNTVLGNVDGHSDSLMMHYYPTTYAYRYYLTEDVSLWPAGMYCFIFNPREDAGESDIRLTRTFYLGEGNLAGGGQIVEVAGSKPKDTYKISFGADLWDVGSAGFMGELEVNFHNVSNDSYDRTKFHGSEVLSMNFYSPTSSTCTAAMNATLRGEWEGIPGYKVTIRAGDYNSPGMFTEESFDTIRFELRDPMNTLVYDSHAGDFTDESTCVGSARTGLDRGNLTIWMR